MEGKGCCAVKPTENSCSTEKTASCGDKKPGDCGDGGNKSQCCPGTIIKGAIIGGIIMFVWFALSWMVFPWHGITVADNLRHVDKLAAYFVFCLVAAALLTKILKKRAGGCPVAGSIVIGLLVALFSYVPNFIWMNMSLKDSLIDIANDVIAVTLAGAAIGKLVLNTGICPTKVACGDEDKKADKAAGGCCDKNTPCH